MKEVICLENIGISYPKERKLFRAEQFWALTDVSFSVSESEIVGVVGDNGAGKSTLLKLVAGILKPNIGTVRVSPGKTISLVSLQAGFKNLLSGRENAIISGVLLGLSRREVLDKMEAIEELADIHPFFDRPIRTYSSGMRSRLGFSIAYHVDPDIMLLDEVLSVGDRNFTHRSKELITNKIMDGKTAIIVSHSEHLLKEICSRLIWIKEGKVFMDDDTYSVWEEYKENYKKRKGWA